MKHVLKFVLVLLLVIHGTTCVSWLGAAQANAATIRLPQTGQTKCYDTTGNETNCAGTGQDGDKKKGAAWPDPRFTDQGNGTVTDNLTGLIWLKDGFCPDMGWAVRTTMSWPDAMNWVSSYLGSGKCGLSDGSVPGDWRLPNIVELKSLVDLSQWGHALAAGHPFSNIMAGWYWSSSIIASEWYDGSIRSYAWMVSLNDGSIDFYEFSGEDQYSLVLPVRGGP